MPINLKMNKNGKNLRKIEITNTDSRSNRKYEQSLVQVFPQIIQEGQTVLQVISHEHWENRLF